MIDVQMFPANVIDHDGHPLLASVSDLISIGRQKGRLDGIQNPSTAKNRMKIFICATHQDLATLSL